MFKWFKRENWRLVKTIGCNTVYCQRYGKVYYHLFESNKGNRKTKVSSLDSNLIDIAKNFDIYQEKIYRWEHGRHDPDIPSYNQILEEDTVNMLRGKI